jgi:glycosyltransferase involved in cell wall biosynthesis
LANLALLLPCAAADLRGNSTTAQRIAKGLTVKGHVCEIVGLGETPPQETELILALHAGHSAKRAQDFGKAQNIPYVILFTGTDLNGKPSAETCKAVNSAAALICLAQAPAKRALELFGRGLKIEVIPQAPLALPWKPGLKAPAEFNLDPDLPLLLVPSGIRAVKNPRRLVEALIPLAQEGVAFQLLFVGPELEQEEGEKLRQLLEPLAWASWPGAVERPILAALMERCLGVLSASKSEGGAPNSLLEAGMASRPILASSISVHKEFPGEPWVFGSDPMLRSRVRQWIDAPIVAAREGRSLREFTRRYSDPRREAAEWDRIVKAVFAPPKPSPYGSTRLGEDSSKA